MSDHEPEQGGEGRFLEVPLPHAEAPAVPPRLLGNPPFLWLVGGDSLENLGRWAFFLAVVGDATYRLDATPAQVGFLLASFSVPLILSSPLYGAAADRWSAKWLLVATGAAASAIPLVAMRTEAMGGLYAASAAYGMLHGAVLPARGALVPRLVPRHRLVQANGMLSAALAVQLVVGPALAALLVRLGGSRAPYMVTVAAAALGALAYLAVPDRRAGGSAPPGPLFGDIAAGFREGWATPLLRRLLLIAVSIWFLIGLLVALEPIYIRDVVGRGQAFLGVVWAVYGAGEVVGSVLLARVRTGAGREPTLVAFGLLLASVGFLLYASVPSPLTVVAANVVFGLGFPFYTATANALIQRIATHPGKVTAAFSMAGEGGPVGASALLLATGGALSVRSWLLLSGAAFSVVALAALRIARREAAVEPPVG